MNSSNEPNKMETSYSPRIPDDLLPIMLAQCGFRIDGGAPDLVITVAATSPDQALSLSRVRPLTPNCISGSVPSCSRYPRNRDFPQEDSVVFDQHPVDSFSRNDFISLSKLRTYRKIFDDESMSKYSDFFGGSLLPGTDNFYFRFSNGLPQYQGLPFEAPYEISIVKKGEDHCILPLTWDDILRVFRTVCARTWVRTEPEGRSYSRIFQA